MTSISGTTHCWKASSAVPNPCALREAPVAGSIARSMGQAFPVRSEPIGPNVTILDSGDDHGCRNGPPACRWVPAGASAPDVIVDKDFGIRRELVVAPIGRSAITLRP